VLFGGTLSGSIVLDAIIEKRKHSYEVLCCLSLSQTNFTTLAKTAAFHLFFDVERAKPGGRMNLLADPLVDRLYLVQW